jgi:hypothetical protein
VERNGVGSVLEPAAARGDSRGSRAAVIVRSLFRNVEERRFALAFGHAESG